MLATIYPYLVLIPVVIGIAACDGPGRAKGVEEVWRLGGFSQPESVVYDQDRQVFYVSNIAGNPTDADGIGFISTVQSDGQMGDLHWVDGLDAPKGLALSGQTLYVADLNAVIAIDTVSGIKTSYPIPDGQLLNDVTVADDGAVYVSDTFTNKIYVMRDGRVTVFIESLDLESPNGLYAKPDRMLVASWGVRRGNGFETSELGRILALDYGSLEIAPVFEQRLGNLDGIESDGEDGFYITDWMSGDLFHVNGAGDRTPLVNLGQGSADHFYDDEQGIIVVPQMLEGEIIAYQVVP